MRKENMGNSHCLGVHCPVKNQCMRHTHLWDGIIRKCSNQRLFLQDTEKINGDSLRR